MASMVTELRKELIDMNEIISAMQTRIRFLHRRYPCAAGNVVTVLLKADTHMQMAGEEFGSLIKRWE